MSTKMSSTKKLAASTLYAALQALQDNGGELRGKKVLEEVDKRVVLDNWARGVCEKTGNIRWQSVLHFYTIDAIEAGR